MSRVTGPEEHTERCRARAQEAVRAAMDAGADACDAVCVEGLSFEAEVRAGEVEKIQESQGSGLGLRVFRRDEGGMRQAIVHTTVQDADMAALAADAVALAEATGADPAGGLPDPDELADPDDLPEVPSFDADCAGLTAETLIGWARDSEQAARDHDPRIVNTQKATAGRGVTASAVASSAGFSGVRLTSRCSFGVMPLARDDERDGERQTSYWYTQGRGPGDLDDPAEVGRIAAERTLAKLGWRPAPTGRFPVVFEPEVGRGLIGLIADCAMGSSAYQRNTFLLDREGEQVAHEGVTVVDDPLEPAGLSARPFDGEGVRVRRNRVLDAGVFGGFLCDTYSGRRLDRPTTGNAGRGVSGGPSPTTTNLYLQPGDHTPDDVLRSVDQGLYVTQTLGFGLNKVTGDFSRGIVGRWIENGEPTWSVQESTMAGDLRQMIRDLDMIADDLTWRGSTAAPTFRIAEMTLSGDAGE